MFSLSRAMVILALALATLVTASSVEPAPLQRLGLAKQPSILTPTHRVTALSTFDLVFDFSGRRLRLSLEPNHDIFVDGATVRYLGADGRLRREEPVDRLQHKVFKGTAWLRRADRWDAVGWARIDVRQDGIHPLFEGTFVVDHDHHHIQLASSYKQTRRPADPDVDLRNRDFMVVFRDSDRQRPQERSELRKREASPVCASDSMAFNTEHDHAVYAAMRPPQDGSFLASPFSSLLRKKRQLDTSPLGGNGAGVNLLQSIGSTAGCPTTRKVALVGVATDCTYTQSFNSSTSQTRDNVIRQMNSASELFESTFNISLGLANLVVTEANCPTTPQQATPWNRACSNDIDMQKRLNLFSQWRGQQEDKYSHWTLLSTCNSGSAVGLAWLGQACTSASTQSNSSQGDAETVAGANVVIRTSTEWQVLAHENGHTFGAVHDCTATSCSNSDMVNAQQCCPLSTDKCDAGEQFIMNPSTAQGITRFSPCSIGNICAALGRNSVKSSCLTNNRGVTTITGQTCGNGIVEGDEECDCGGEAGCGNNACCDAKTCRFNNNAVCDDSNEDCCKDCQFASAQTVCRPSSGTCDPQETCSGTSPYCPEDKTRDDGSDCGNGLKCASGQCTSRDQQCKTVMGSYTQGNDTYACDSSNCQLSCASPEFGRNVCYGLQQNFLDGTPCVGGGKCSNGQCTGSSVANEVKSWIMENKSVVMGVASAIGGLILVSIIGCCWRRYRRRKQRKAYVKNTAPLAAPPRPPLPSHALSQGPSYPPRGGPPRHVGGSRPYMAQAPSNPWVPQTNHGVQTPAPLYRSGSVRYA